MESAAGVANFSDVDGLDAVQYTFAQAAKDGQTVVRVFGHGINETLVLQERPGKVSFSQHTEPFGPSPCCDCKVAGRVPICTFVRDISEGCAKTHICAVRFGRNLTMAWAL